MFYDEKTLELYEEIPDIKVYYYLLTGLSYREIGIRFYYHIIQINLFIVSEN